MIGINSGSAGGNSGSMGSTKVKNARKRIGL